MNGILCEGITDPPGSPHRRCIPIDTRPGCDPRCGEHDQANLGYVAHFEWAEEMLKTHDQRQCPGCGMWSIWELKETNQ